MNYYKLIDGDIENYYAEGESNVTSITLTYKDSVLDSADYDPTIEDVPMEAISSDFDEFVQARSVAEGLHDDGFAFVGTSPIHH